MLLNFGIKFFIIFILEDILDPPIIHVIGFFIFDVILLRAFTSALIWIPLYDGIYFVIFDIEAWSLCEHENASLTYISPKLANFFENLSSLASSSG